MEEGSSAHLVVVVEGYIGGEDLSVGPQQGALSTALTLEPAAVHVAAGAQTGSQPQFFAWTTDSVVSVRRLIPSVPQCLFDLIFFNFTLLLLLLLRSDIKHF